uniref:Phosphatidylinositol N-acetylglucosaminyltransferase subunit H conserved domain-containing protein n=1 Tax=Davidia involucrata TaxID=16924 RepID=A0A5B7BQK0_DAVIN
MAESSMANARYTYVHHVNKGPLQAMDMHHIVVRKSGVKGFIVYLSVLLLTTNGFFLFLLKDKTITVLFWSLLLSAFLVKLFLRKPVQKVSVIIFPGFGVQLETQYGSGRTIRHFVPIGKILKPVLNECVTPVTCYWSLSLIIRGDEELMLVFKELHPPVKMLVPIWKALCAATDSLESADSIT